MKKTFHAGDLDRTGIHYRRNNNLDAHGQTLYYDTTPAGEYPCYKEALSGTEGKEFNGGATGDLVLATAKVRFVIRYTDSPISPLDKWECDGVQYDIQSVDELPGSRRQWLVLTGERVSA